MKEDIKNIIIDCKYLNEHYYPLCICEFKMVPTDTEECENCEHRRRYT